MKTHHYVLSMTAAVAQLLASSANADVERLADVPRIVVTFGDLDLSKPAGSTALYERIQSAAEIVCRVNESRQLALIARSRACYRSAIDDAVAQIDHPRLTALHDRKVGKEEVVRAAKR